MPDRPVRKWRLVSFAPGRSHGPNAGRPGVVPRGETMGTLEEKLFSVYDKNTARVQTGRQFYIYLPARPIDTSLPTRNARAPREQLSARHLASRYSRHTGSGVCQSRPSHPRAGVMKSWVGLAFHRPLGDAAARGVKANFSACQRDAQLGILDSVFVWQREVAISKRLGHHARNRTSRGCSGQSRPRIDLSRLSSCKDYSVYQITFASC